MLVWGSKGSPRVLGSGRSSIDLPSKGEVAKAAGVGVETVRFYECKGLIPDPPRRPSGYRAYSEGVVDRIVFIRHAKELGFSLKEIRDIESKNHSLQRLRRTLRKLALACDERSPTSECPILGAIEQGGSR